MQVTISNRIRIDDPTDQVSDWCRKNLVLPNPEYAKKQRMGFWVGNTPKEIRLYETEGTSLLIPYGCYKDVLGFISDPRQLKMQFQPSDAVDYGIAKIPLYDYQLRALTRMLTSHGGVLISPAGSGKTQIGVALAAYLSRKTLWLTHTLDLLTQSKERAEQYIPSRVIGTITGGKVEIGEGITFATVQTMCRLDLTLYRDLWDVVIVDECHRCAVSASSTTQFAKVLNNLSARHKYGLTATAHRADGLIAATYALLGPIIYEVPESAVAEKIVKVSILPRYTKTELSPDCLDTDGTLIYSRLIDMLTANEDRCRQIIGDLITNSQHYCLILSDRLDHLRHLMTALPPQLQGQAVMVDGSMTSRRAKADRKQALDDMRQGNKHYLFATYALAKEGLDVPRLDRLFLTTPQKDYAVVTQSVGRIARAFDGKEEPIVYDYVDDHIGYLVRVYKKRCTSYRKLGCKFKEETK